MTGAMAEEPAAAPDRDASDGPLAGLRIVELGSILAGPFATRLLADLGAEVIKVEAPDRLDPMREWGQGEVDGRSLWWPVISRNKKLVTLDLRSARGQALFLDLVRRADAIVENFRPGTLERWNLSWERLHAVNRCAVLVRVSGYGQTGPYAGRAGFAAAAEAMGGLRYINGFPDGPPPRIGISLGDSLAGMFAAQGLLAALYRRDALGGGDGQVVDVSIVESCFAMLESIVPEYDRLGLVRGPSGTRLDGNAPSNVYRSADDRPVVIAANQDGLFGRLCAAMERPELATDPRFSNHGARGEHQDVLDEEIGAWARQRSAAEIDERLSRAGVVCAPVYTIADIFEDPHFRAREMLVDHDDAELGALKGPGVVPKFSADPGSVRWSGRWEAGADNAEVFGGLLGRSEGELEQLRSEGVV
jgi:formyl-CoA transferase